MSIDLEDNWESNGPSALAHFWDTIRVLGGAKGLAVMVVVLYIFYSLVEWFITSSRTKRRLKKSQ